MSEHLIPSLSESQLDAFYVIAQEGSFTKASQVLHISQPALSRRLQSLEETLELTLFDRTPLGVELTESGQKLLVYVKNKRLLELEAITDLKGEREATFSGLIRIAGPSSMIEPLVMPALAAFFIKHPNVQVEFVVKANSALDEMLNYSKTDLVMSNTETQKKDTIEYLLGEEEYICVESAKIQTRSTVYLDTNPSDTITESFLQQQPHPQKKYVRSYMHDENGILTGARLGYGRAIKPRHTLKRMDGLKVVRGFTPLRRPVYLRFNKKQYFTKLEQTIIEILQKEIPKIIRS